MAEEVLPPWLLCASSMMMAKCLPFASFSISSRMNGNFCTVLMMIFLPLLDELPQVAGMFGVADRRADLHELLDRLLDLVVEDAAVRHHDHGVEDLLFVLALAR